MTQTVRSLNATTADDSPTFESPEVDFQRFDRFPPALRWRIANNNTKLAAAGFERHYDWARTRGGAGLTIRRIDEIEINEIAVFADPPHEAKAEWLKDHNASLLFDNSKKNAKLAPCLALVPWQTRTD